jgi:hypothetical protein
MMNKTRSRALRGAVVAGAMALLLGPLSAGAQEITPPTPLEVTGTATIPNAPEATDECPAGVIAVLGTLGLTFPASAPVNFTFEWDEAASDLSIGLVVFTLVSGDITAGPLPLELEAGTATVSGTWDPETGAFTDGFLDVDPIQLSISGADVTVVLSSDGISGTVSADGTEVELTVAGVSLNIDITGLLEANCTLIADDLVLTAGTTPVPDPDPAPEDNTGGDEETPEAVAATPKFTG